LTAGLRCEVVAGRSLIGQVPDWPTGPPARPHTPTTLISPATTPMPWLPVTSRLFVSALKSPCTCNGRADFLGESAAHDSLHEPRLIPALTSETASERSPVMKRTGESEPSATGITQAANSMAVTLSGVYLATHSVVVTAFATGGSILLTVWAWWEPYRRNRGLIAGETRAPRSSPDPVILDTDGSRPGSAH
jgi:hypothetical protein